MGDDELFEPIEEDLFERFARLQGPTAAPSTGPTAVPTSVTLQLPVVLELRALLQTLSEELGERQDIKQAIQQIDSGATKEYSSDKYGNGPQTVFWNKSGCCWVKVGKKSSEFWKHESRGSIINVLIQVPVPHIGMLGCTCRRLCGLVRESELLWERVCKRDERLGYTIPPRGTWVDRRRKAKLPGYQKTPRSTRSSVAGGSRAQSLSPMHGLVEEDLFADLPPPRASPCSPPGELLWAEGDSPTAASRVPAPAANASVSRDDILKSQNSTEQQQSATSPPGRLAARIKSHRDTPEGTPRSSGRPLAPATDTAQHTDRTKQSQRLPVTDDGQRLPHSHPSIRGTPRTAAEETRSDSDDQAEMAGDVTSDDDTPPDGAYTARSYGSLANSAVMLKESWQEESQFSPEVRDRNASTENVTYY